MLLPEELRNKVAAKILTLLDVDVLVNLPADEQINAANEIIAARGKRKRKLNVNPKFRRKFRYRRCTEEINGRIGEMMQAGLSGLATRAMSWCAGYISDDDFDLDIQRELPALSGDISEIKTSS